MALTEKDCSYLLENLMVTFTDFIYFKDTESRFIKVNEAFARKFGWDSPKVCTGKTDFDLYTEEHAAQAFADEQRIIKTGEPLRGAEEKETLPDGSITWASTTKMPLRDKQGNIIGTFGISRDITEHKEAELRAAYFADEMRRIKDEMVSDARMAGELQKAFIASDYPTFPPNASPADSCVEFLHRTAFFGQVSGDYCSINRISDTEASIFLCDARGVGVRSALATGLIRGVMQEIAPLATDPGTYLTRMNELLTPLLGQNKELDVTACQMTLDTSTGKLHFASAGHPMPILFRAGKGADWLSQNPEAYGPALARIETTDYTTTKFQMKPDDVVVMFTDGLFSVPNNTGNPFGLKRLLDSARSLVGDPLEDIFEGLEGDALAFSKTCRFIDDVCIVGFHLKTLTP